MSSSPTLLQWITALVLLAFFSWALLGLFWDVLPLSLVNSNEPQKRIFGIAFLIVAGLLNYFFARAVLEWVWVGLIHILGLDLEGL